MIVKQHWMVRKCIRALKVATFPSDQNPNNAYTANNSIKTEIIPVDVVEL